MLQEFQLKEFETNGISVRAAVEGTGPLVIMVHGFPDPWICARISDSKESSKVRAIGCNRRPHKK
jgi:hypothetical protein